MCQGLPAVDSDALNGALVLIVQDGFALTATRRNELDGQPSAAASMRLRARKRSCEVASY
jgi:hypothetical protein